MKGFTLIELLVVMAILGLLAVIGLGSFQSSQMKARDAQRKSDFTQIQKALEMYYNDHKGYPVTDAVPFGDAWEDDSGTLYMKTVPNDPKGCNYRYSQKESGQGYALYGKLENTQDRSIGAYSATCCGTANDCNYAVSSTNVTP